MAIGAHNSEVWRTALERLIAFRDRGNEDRFHDLSFEAVQRDPIGQVSRLYAELGDDLERRGPPTDGATGGPRARRTAPGRRSYAPEDFGLDLTTIADTFAFYNERFGIPVARSLRHDRAVPSPDAQGDLP